MQDTDDMKNKSSCALCGSSENVLKDHYEAHIKRRLDICERCHGYLHIAIYYHPYNVLWAKGMGKAWTKEAYKEMHEILVRKGVIKCNECSRR